MVISNMANFHFYSDKPASSISFEKHTERLQYQIKELLIELQTFVKNLGENIIEDMRPHRIVYAKTLTFRTFLNIQPKADCLDISIRKNRNGPLINFSIRNKGDLENVKERILDAYNNIK